MEDVNVCYNPYVKCYSQSCKSDGCFIRAAARANKVPKRNQCLYCPDNDCGTKPCYIEVMNKSGSEHKILDSGLIVPIHYIPKLKRSGETLFGGASGSGKRRMLLKQIRDKVYKELNKPMNIYSFPLTRCSRNIWCTRDGKMIPVNKLPLPHFENIYDKLMRSAWHIVGEQSRVDKVCGYLAYEGRYGLMRIQRTVYFLKEFCPSWSAIVTRAYKEGICDLAGIPASYNDINDDLQITIPRRHKIAMEKLREGSWDLGQDKAGFKMDAVVNDKIKMTNGKLMTDSSGKQYLLFPIE